MYLRAYKIESAFCNLWRHTYKITIPVVSIEASNNLMSLTLKSVMVSDAEIMHTHSIDNVN